MTRWETAKLGGLVTFKTGKIDSNAATPDGEYPFFTCSQETLRTDTYAFDTECVLLAGNNANGIYPLKYYSGKFNAYQRTYVVRSQNDEQLINHFLFYALQLKLDLLRRMSTGAATKFLTLTILKDFDFELPPLGMDEYRNPQKVKSEAKVIRGQCEAMGSFDDLVRIGMGKEALTALFSWLAQAYKLSLNRNDILSAIASDAVPPEIGAMLEKLKSQEVGGPPAQAQEVAGEEEEDDEGPELDLFIT